MSESKQRRFLPFDADAPKRLEPLIETRQTGINPDGSPRISRYIIGHGQQLADKRLDERIAAQPATPLNIFPRQEMRRHVRKDSKSAAKRNADRDRLDALKAMRKARPAHQSVKQGPGKLIGTMRAYKKAHGQMNRSLIQETTVRRGIVEGGRFIAAFYEQSLHATKGLRTRRLPA